MLVYVSVPASQLLPSTLSRLGSPVLRSTASHTPRLRRACVCVSFAASCISLLHPHPHPHHLFTPNSAHVHTSFPALVRRTKGSGSPSPCAGVGHHRSSLSLSQALTCLAVPVLSRKSASTCDARSEIPPQRGVRSLSRPACRLLVLVLSP
ncbi:hypothetical protein BKA62DRAFT_35450 [Auriculariales sp. MPI-PUGE-AT-0066]|nr:hypothetical protein BKA62DRAFT_35450 [Auriculariales sp. MPI-PUGE-AT-0066]